MTTELSVLAVFGNEVSGLFCFSWMRVVGIMTEPQILFSISGSVTGRAVTAVAASKEINVLGSIVVVCENICSSDFCDCFLCLDEIYWKMLLDLQTDWKCLGVLPFIFQAQGTFSP
jgi:hypothetical protein